MQEGTRRLEAHGPGWRSNQVLSGLFAGSPFMVENSPCNKALQEVYDHRYKLAVCTPFLCLAFSSRSKQTRTKTKTMKTPRIFCPFWTQIRMVSEYCSACVSCVGLSTKQAAEPYSDNLLNRTRNPLNRTRTKKLPLKDL